MPLRDHFRPPLSERASWDGLHGGWLMMIVEGLNPHLPPEYVAAPLVHLGSSFEVDVATFEADIRPGNGDPTSRATNGSRPSAFVAPAPSLTIDFVDAQTDTYEVQVYDINQGRRLVAAIEIVSPSNIDRPERRRAFVETCMGMLRTGVSLAIVDVITTRSANPYQDLLESLSNADPESPGTRGPIYAASCRTVRVEDVDRLEA